MGGVDLSGSLNTSLRLSSVPARVGGVDLSMGRHGNGPKVGVPARVGGVDLSSNSSLSMYLRGRPRPCGRGGFKLLTEDKLRKRIMSPPVWAGWI